SWSPERMRAYFERLENCQYAPPAAPGQTADPETRHGLAGWLPTSMPDPTLVLGPDPAALLTGQPPAAGPDQGDPAQLLKILLHAFLAAHLASGPPPTAREADADPAKRLARAFDVLLDAAQRAVARGRRADRATVERLREDFAKL